MKVGFSNLIVLSGRIIVQWIKINLEMTSWYSTTAQIDQKIKKRRSEYDTKRYIKLCSANSVNYPHLSRHEGSPKLWTSPLIPSLAFFPLLFYAIFPLFSAKFLSRSECLCAVPIAGDDKLARDSVSFNRHNFWCGGFRNRISPIFLLQSSQQALLSKRRRWWEETLSSEPIRSHQTKRVSQLLIHIVYFSFFVALSAWDQFK